MKKLLFLGMLCFTNLVFAQTLLELVEGQKFAEAETIIKTGVDVNQPSADGTTALHWAAYYGELELAKKLLRAEAKADTQNDYGSSPVMEAAIHGDTDMLKLLINAGADVESVNAEGQTALMAIARTGNVDAANFLVRKGADVNAAEHWGGQSVLMWAAARKHPEMIKFLVKKGAKVDQRAIDRNWERRVTSEPRVKEMLTGGFTALLYAVREDCLDCVKALLDAGADINKPDPDNISPLILALLNMRFDIAKYLVEQGADVNQWDYWGRTPLYAAADTNIAPTMSARGDLRPIQQATGLEVARMLLERGANPDYFLKLAPPPRNITNDRAGDNPVMNTGSTPLQRAAYGGDVAMMQLLLEYNANWRLGNVSGVTPLIAMTNSGGSRGAGKNEESVVQGLKVLIAAGADINTTGGAFAETPLHTTARLNWLKVANFLVENGANVTAQDNRGLTPFDYATGKADSQSFGNFNVVGDLPEMAELLQSFATKAN